MSRGSGTLRWPVGVTTGAVEKTLGLTFPDGTVALGALEEPDAIVNGEDEDEVKKRVCKVDKFVCKWRSLKAR